MIIGKGWLGLRGGGRVAVEYHFGSDYDDRRAGYLLCDTSLFDPGEFSHRLMLSCEDGSQVVIAVANYSDRHMAVIGQVLERDQSAAA